MNARYEEEVDPKTEQELWDEEQTARAVGKDFFNKTKKTRYDVDDADYVFEDAVEFARAPRASVLIWKV